MGLYAVKPALQGRGIGIKVWTHIMSHIKEKNAGLYAVPEHQSTYRDRAGFKLEDSIKMSVWESESRPRLGDLVKEIGNVVVQEITSNRLGSLFSYDRDITRVDRSELLEVVLKERDSIALIALETDQKEVGVNRTAPSQTSRLLGYICCRTNNIGKAMCGPLYANNDAIAELLLFHALSRFHAADKGLLFMTLDGNPGGDRIADKMGLEREEPSIPRFFTQKIPEADFRRIYCIHSPNFSPY